MKKLIIIIFNLYFINSFSQTQNKVLHHNNLEDNLMLIGVSDSTSDIILYDNNHRDNNVQWVVSKIVKYISDKRNVNYFVEQNAEDIEMYKYFMENDSIVLAYNYFWNFCRVSDDDVQDEFEQKLRGGKINLFGYDCTTFNEITIRSIIDSTKKEFRKKGIERFELLDSVEYLLYFAPSLNMVLSTISSSEYKQFYNVYEIVINNVSSALKKRWENMRHFFYWTSSRGILFPEPGKKITAKEHDLWYSYREWRIYQNFLELFQNIEKRTNIIAIGGGHSARHGIKYKHIRNEDLSPSISDYFNSNGRNNYHRVLITNPEDIDFQYSKKFLNVQEVFIDSIKVDVITPRENNKRKNIFFKLARFSNYIDKIEANWFESFDYIIVINKIKSSENIYTEVHSITY